MPYFKIFILSATLFVTCVSANRFDSPGFSPIVTSTPEASSSTISSPILTEDKDLNQRQIEDASQPDFVDQMFDLFIQMITPEEANPSNKEEAKSIENAEEEGRGMHRLKKFLVPFLLGVSLKTKALIVAAIGFLLVLTKITFIKAKLALMIGVGLLLYHLYVKKHAIHHIKHALHQPHYDVSAAWSAPYAAWAIPDFGVASAAAAAAPLPLPAPVSPPFILRKKFEEHQPSIRFRKRRSPQTPKWRRS